MTAKEWLKLAYYRPVVFGHECGFTDLSEMHNDWIRSFIYGKGDMTLQAHRGSYKTTCISIAIAIMIVIYPDKTILFQRKTDSDTREIIVQVMKILSSDIFVSMSNALYEMDPKLTTKNRTEISTVLKASPRGVSQVVGMGTTSSITGKHFDIVITDDIVNVSDRISKAERERTKLVYQELQNIRNRGGRIINTGTPWHKDDAFSLMPEAEKFDCYSTGLMADKDIKELKKKMTPSLFAANYELKHISDDQNLFVNPNIDDGTSTEKIYDGICHIDSAYGGGTGDTVAFTIAKKQPDGKIYVYGLVREGHVNDHLPEFERRREQYRAGTLYSETNADKGYLLQRVKEPRQGYHEKMNKYVKITSYIKPVWEDIVFIQGTDEEYLTQILDYTEQATVDDAPDSLASAVRVLARNRKRQSMETQAQALKGLGL